MDNLKDHISSVVNSLGETFIAELGCLQNEISSLKTSVASKFENYNAKFCEYEQAIISNQSKIDQLEKDKSPQNSPEQTPFIRNIHTPININSEGAFQSPKRPVWAMNTIKTNPIQLTNRYQPFEDENREPRSWEPD